MESEERLVSYTSGKQTTNGMLVKVGTSYYILHNDKNLPGCSQIGYDPWIKKFGKEFKYYNNCTMKNVKELSETYELWN